jgi:hypothetical protein
MSDNLRRYRAIHTALLQAYPGALTGTLVRHLTTLAAFISGIVGSQSTQLPKIAARLPEATHPESRVKRLARWLKNEHVTQEIYFVPYAKVLLAHLALPMLVLVMDGSVVGRGCVALMLHVVYQGRALPVAWLVRSGTKGHFPEDLHMALVAQVRPLIPPGARVVLLGDGEFDGTTFQETIHKGGWSYVVRTGSHITVLWDGEHFRCETIAACIKPGTLVILREARVTADAYGPVLLLCCWAKGYQKPLYLVTNLASADEACHWYAKRFRIERFFSDQKRRGFHLHRSHVSDPARLSRLLMGACLAYLWIIHLGALCEHKGWISRIHRGERCDLSLFQLGLRWLDYVMNRGDTIPVAFYVLL